MGAQRPPVGTLGAAPAFEPAMGVQRPPVGAAAVEPEMGAERRRRAWPDAAIAALAGGQHGVVARGRLLSLGLGGEPSAIGWNAVASTPFIVVSTP